MLKVLVVLQRKEGTSREEFRRYWSDIHGPIGMRMPKVQRYVQNHVLADGAPFDGVAEMWFDSPVDMQAAFTSDAAAEAARDTENFLSGTQVVMVEEVEMPLPASA